MFTATMSKGIFRDILKYMRFDDKSTREKKTGGRQVSCFPRHPANVQISAAQVFRSWVRPMRRRATCDISRKMQFPPVGYIPSKPAKYGIKIRWCCDSDTSYPLTAEIYLGEQKNAERKIDRTRNKSGQNSNRTLARRKAVVLDYQRRSNKDVRRTDTSFIINGWCI